MVSRLEMDRVWLVECSRCANSDYTLEPDHEDAEAELAELGWISDDAGDQFCPKCSEDAT